MVIDNEFCWFVHDMERSFDICLDTTFVNLEKARVTNRRTLLLHVTFKRY